jgi:ATPase family associated with various cellular activities (AAA)
MIATASMLGGKALTAELARAARLVRAGIAGGSAASEIGGASQAGAPPLQRLAEVFGLTPIERDVVLIALAVEVDAAIGALFATYHRDPHALRPTVGALGAILDAPGHSDREVATALAAHGHLARSGLIELGADGPHVSRTVRVPDSLWPRLAGLPAADPFPLVSSGSAAIDALVLADATRAQLDALQRAAASHPRSAALVWVTGAIGAGREAVAVAVAGALGFAALRIAAGTAEDPVMTPRLAREAAWNAAALVIAGAPSEAALTRLAQEVSTPLVIVAPRVGIGGDGSDRWRVEVAVAALSLDEREQIWRRALAEVPMASDVDLRVVAAQLPIGPGRITSTAARLREVAVARGSAITPTDVRVACRGDGPGAMLAQRLDGAWTLDDLVVATATRRELELALSWARHASSVFHPGGTGRRLRGFNGLVCLFYGPPGTGKTMAAQVLAHAIGADLLRVDLARVVDKYIGETEKNLDRVFAEAEATGAVLLFDEAEALFGKRSEVKDAHDRYANLETAFLLQRLEEHRGVCVLASNLRDNLDSAFTRRIHVVAEFTPPGRVEREQLWERQLPQGALAADVDLGALAERAALCGGDIRNAAAAAALLAASTGEPIAMRHLVIGIWRELRKSGRLISPDDFGPWRDAVHAYLRE